jgi:predicted dithiol-disulfide oxidoreductase (DUF899 family)
VFPNHLDESPDYLAQRAALQDAEVALMRQREHVAALRRAHPPGPVVDDYVFEEGPRQLGDGDGPVTTVRLSQLFTSPERTLVLYHLMLGKAQTSPCPMCTMWIDGFNGVARHLGQNMSDDIDQRGIDLLTPAWHLLDLTPQGRGEWFAGLDY